MAVEILVFNSVENENWFLSVLESGQPLGGILYSDQIATNLYEDIKMLSDTPEWVTKTNPARTATLMAVMANDFIASYDGKTIALNEKLKRRRQIEYLGLED